MPRSRGPQSPRSSRQRDVDTRDTVPKFLIVCEGQSTEPNYFRAFRVPADVMRLDVYGTGRNTISLVKEALRRMQEGEYDRVWCVMDRDDFPHAQFEQALTTARRHNIEVAYSNVCFELWYVLHFAYHDIAYAPADYADKLSKLLGRAYRKNSSDMYKALLSRQRDAIRNAAKLLESYQPSRPATDDPSTTVHLLVEELRRASR